MGKQVWVSAVSGPLAPFAAGYESWLSSRSYSPSAAADRLRQLGQLSRWLEQERLGAGELTDEQAGRFVADRRAAGRLTWVSPQSWPGDRNSASKTAQAPVTRARKNPAFAGLLSGRPDLNR